MKYIKPYNFYEANCFFFESWLLNELSDQEYPAFVSGLHIKESTKGYHLSIDVDNVTEGDYSIHVELPYLYISLQQREYPHELLGLLRRPPIVRVFSRHLLIPGDVNADRIVYHLGANNLFIYLPKYSRL
jgi:hypothetical protein